MSAFSTSVTLAVTNNLATTGALAVGRHEVGRIICKTYNAGGIVLTCYESDTRQGEYTLCTDAGTAGVLAAIDDDTSIALPTVLNGSRFLKFVADIASCSFIVTLKGV